MLEKLIKKMHVRLAFSVYGILTIITMLLPLVIIGFGIYFLVAKTNNSGVMWIIIGVAAILISVRKLKDYFVNIKYIISPKKYPTYKKLIEEGLDPSIFDNELTDADPVHTLNKKNPILMTKNFIFGYNQVAFFVLDRNKIVWAYEYNGNGIVFLDYYKNYGFTYFVTVDGNDELMETLKHEMPYIYLGIDFDYKTVMHDNFDEAVRHVEDEKQAFLLDPDGYRERKAQEEEAKAQEEAKRLEEEKAKAIAEVEATDNQTSENETSDTESTEEAEQEETEDTAEEEAEEDTTE